jgi:hypothetical protein
LASHQAGQADAYRMRLRVGLGHGMVAPDHHGQWSGAVILDLARLVDAAQVREALARARQAHLVLVVSEDVYQSVVRQGRPGVDLAAYGSTEIVTKNGRRLRAWVTVPGHPAPPGLSQGLEGSSPSEAHGGQVTVSGDRVAGSKSVYMPGGAPPR